MAARPPVSLPMTFSLWPRSLSTLTWGAPKSTPSGGQVADFVHHRRHVQQRLGGDAAHVQAHAAQGGVALDQNHLEAQVGRAEGGRVAARAAAQHQHVAVQIGTARQSWLLQYWSCWRLCSGRWSLF
jgi:hypothetical protein